MQSIYDNDILFNNYLELREEEDNFNDLFEQPKMMELLGSVKDKNILELGCGFGSTAVRFVCDGAKHILATDLSQKMLDLAIEKNSFPEIEYKMIPTENLSALDGEYDIVYSSLMFHYISDLKSVFSEAYRLLADDGILLFSMEHPIITASIDSGCDIFGDCDDFGDSGTVVAYQMDHYSKPGNRFRQWLGTTVEKQHHTLSQIINDLIGCEFIIEHVEEPLPDKKTMKKYPRLRSEICRPSYLMVKCRKPKKIII